MSADVFLGERELLARLPAESAIVALSASAPSGDAAFAAAFDRPHDWERVLGLAGRERAIAPLYDRLRRVRRRLSSEQQTARLERLAIVSEFQLAALHDRLARMLALFAEHGVEALLLKGAALAHSVYERPTDRPMGDIDLLVRPESAGRAWELVLANGWRRRRDVAAERSYEDHQHLPPLEDTDGLEMGLELHTALFTHQAPFHLPAAQLWEGARTLSVGGAAALVARPEDQLVHAALHFAWSHEMSFGTWRTLRDVERIVASGSLDWTRFERTARSSRGGTCCYWTLRLARDLAGAAVPEPVLESLTPRLPSAVLRRLRSHFAAQSLPVPGVPPGSISVARTLWTLGIQPRREGHGGSRPWLDTEEWVRGPDGMHAARRSTARRIISHGFGLIRSVTTLVGS